MSGFSDYEDAHDKVYGGQTDRSEWSHELIGGAAACEAMKSIVKNGRLEGEHKLPRVYFAAMAGAEADKLIDTKGLDFLDRERANLQAKQETEKIYDHFEDF